MSHSSPRRALCGLALALLFTGCAADPDGSEGADLDASADASEAGARDASEAGARDASAPEAGGADAGVLDAGRAEAGARDGDADAEPAGGARDARVDAQLPGDASGTRDAEAPGGRSTGCGRAAQGAGEFVRRTTSVANRERVYHVRLPEGYDRARAYPLVFRWHGYGGDGLSGGLGIEYSATRDAIVVGADGLDMGWDRGSEENDLALFDAMLRELGENYCVDLGRVFSYGFSMGGGMSNLLSCRRAAQLRASAAVAGYDRGTGTCARPVAAWFMHDRDDDDVQISQGTGARDRALTRNGCNPAMTRMEGDCVRYTACSPGAPVVWCETQGLGHNIAGESAPDLVWTFFSSLP